MFINIFLVLLALTALAYTWTPPVFNYSYEVALTQTNFISTTLHSVQGKLFYDPLNNRQRVDLENGQFDKICGSVLKGVNTSCISLIDNNKRWQIYPERSQCCLCCESQNGCGFTKPDWLKNADYLGVGQINQERIYDVWDIQDTYADKHVYVTFESVIRRIQMLKNPYEQLDYDVKTFVKKQIDNNVFTLPSYCNSQQPTKCPALSYCSKLRQSSNHLQS